MCYGRGTLPPRLLATIDRLSSGLKSLFPYSWRWSAYGLNTGNKPHAQEHALAFLQVILAVICGVVRFFGKVPQDRPMAVMSVLLDLAVIGANFKYLPSISDLYPIIPDTMDILDCYGPLIRVVYQKRTR